jgi:class 3 adenylate cyclase
VLVSDVVASEVIDDRIRFEAAGSFHVKGKFREVSVYRLLPAGPVVS